MWTPRLTNSLLVLIKIMTKILSALKEHKEILITLLVLSGLSYGLSDFLDFSKTFLLLAALGALYKMYTSNNKSIEQILEEKEEQFKEKYEEYIQKCEATIDEQYVTIKNYEDIFDLQISAIPCNCGNNTFEGIFLPNEENICECEKCNNTYRVTVNFETVLISSPMDGNTH